jgi:hypothetical protein
MPGFDGTGPMGMGPFTGRGMGYCAVPVGQLAPGRGAYAAAPPLYQPMVAPPLGMPGYGFMPMAYPRFWRRPWFGYGRGFGRRGGRRRRWW